MGAAKSKLTVNATSASIANGLLKSTEDCLTYVSADQSIIVSGQDNVVSDVTQTMSMTADASCVGSSVSVASIQNSIKTDVGQTAQTAIDKATDLVDSSGATVETDIAASVETNITEEVAKSCLSALSGKQLVLVTGNNNLVTGTNQEQKANMVSSCLLQTTQGFNAATNIADLVNQQSDYSAKGPIADATDAWASVSKSAIYMIAVFFILIIVAVIMFEVIHSRSPPGAPGEEKKKGSRLLKYGKYALL